jgi:hypothetical protein
MIDPTKDLLVPKVFIAYLLKKEMTCPNLPFPPNVPINIVRGSTWFSGLGLHRPGLALGIVYGDLGTSPLYAADNCAHHGRSTTPEAALGRYL